MKSPILFLPSLLLFGFAFLPWGQTPKSAVNVNTNRQQQIQEIRNELKKLSDRLDELEAQTHHVLPRGGLSEVAPAAGASLSAPRTAARSLAAPTLTPEDASALTLFPGTSINFAVDGYCAYNFDPPVGQGRCALVT